MSQSRLIGEAVSKQQDASVNSNPTRTERVTIVGGALNGGGAERVIIDLCRHLRDSGRDVTLITLTAGEDAYEAPDGVRRERLEVRRKSHTFFHTIWNAIERFATVRRTILKSEPDVVVSFIDRVNIVTLISLIGTRIPTVVSERIHPAYNPIERAWLILRRLVYPLADVVTVQTTEGADWLRRSMRLTNPVVVPNAVREPDDLGDGILSAVVPRPFVLAIGRLEEQKGFDLLLDAFRRTGLTEKGWHLVVLGEGPERQALQKQADLLGMHQTVSFPGFVKVGPWLRAAEIFALSSRFEGFPNALLEAMQMGRACVSFDCPSGPKDLISNGENGLLVPPKDVVALSDAIRMLASDTEFRKRLALEAQAVSQRFSAASVYGRWTKVIDAAVQMRSRSRPLTSRLKAKTQ